MSLTQQSAPYEHWEYLHPASGDRLRIVPERGGLVTEWRCGDREVLYFDQERYTDPTRASGWYSGAFSDLRQSAG